MPGFAPGISPPAVSQSALSPVITTREFLLPGVATSALIRLGTGCPAGHRWECSLTGRPLGSGAAALLSAGLLIPSTSPAFPRTAATDAALVTVASSTSIIHPRGTPGAGIPHAKSLLAGAGGVTPAYPAGTVNAAVVPSGSAFAASPDGRWVFAATAANTLHAYPVQRAAPGATSAGIILGAAIADPVTAPTVGTMTSIDVSADGLWVTVAGGTSPFLEAWAFDPVAGAWGAKAAAPATLPAGAGQSVRFSPDGTMVALGHATSPFISLYAWSAGFGNKAANPGTLPANIVSSVSWHPGSAFLAYADSAASATTDHGIYAITGGATPAFGARTNGTAVAAAGAVAVSFSPDGAFLALAQSAQVLSIWPITAGAFGTRFSTTAANFTASGDRAISWMQDSLSITFLSGAATTLCQSWLLPAASSIIPAPASVRFVGGAQNGAVAGAPVYPLEFAMAAGEELWYQPDATATHIAELLLTIREFAA